MYSLLRLFHYIESVDSHTIIVSLRNWLDTLFGLEVVFLAIVIPLNHTGFLQQQCRQPMCVRLVEGNIRNGRGSASPVILGTQYKRCAKQKMPRAVSIQQPNL